MEHNTSDFDTLLSSCDANSLELATPILYDVNGERFTEYPDGVDAFFKVDQRGRQTPSAKPPPPPLHKSSSQLDAFGELEAELELSSGFLDDDKIEDSEYEGEQSLPKIIANNLI